MIKQTNRELPPIINRYGCYLLSLITMVGEESSFDFDADDIIVVYEVSMSKKYILDNCTIDNPDGVLKVANQVANSGKRILQIGSIMFGKIVYWDWVVSRYPQWINSYNWSIRKYRTKRGYHFVLCKDGKIFYDPETRAVDIFDVDADILYKVV